MKIEVWKCTPAWGARSSSEQSATLRRFTLAVQRYLDDGIRTEGGPYLVQKAGTCLLIWTWEVNHPQVVGAMTELEINRHFEPLVDLIATPKLTAKRLADRLK